MMDRETALEFVTRIENHRAEEDAIWDEMRAHKDYCRNEDQDIKEVIKQRKTIRALEDDVQSILDAFDLVETSDGDFVPRRARD